MLCFTVNYFMYVVSSYEKSEVAEKTSTQFYWKSFLMI